MMGFRREARPMRAPQRRSSPMPMGSGRRWCAAKSCAWWLTTRAAESASFAPAWKPPRFRFAPWSKFHPAWRTCSSTRSAACAAPHAPFHELYRQFRDGRKPGQALRPLRRSKVELGAARISADIAATDVGKSTAYELDLRFSFAGKASTAVIVSSESTSSLASHIRSVSVRR
jgi:hypothetical protein